MIHQLHLHRQMSSAFDSLYTKAVGSLQSSSEPLLVTDCMGLQNRTYNVGLLQLQHMGLQHSGLHHPGGLQDVGLQDHPHAVPTLQQQD